MGVDVAAWGRMQILLSGVTQMQSKDSAKRHFVFWAMRVSPETGIFQVGSGTAEWLVQSY